MRSLAINKQKIYYSNYRGTKALVDEYGNEYGVEVLYHRKRPYWINKSMAKGWDNTEQFGDLDRYERTLTTNDMNCPIRTSAILWVDEKDPTKPHDYIVRRVGDGLNTIQIVIRKVQVDG